MTSMTYSRINRARISAGTTSASSLEAATRSSKPSQSVRPTEQLTQQADFLNLVVERRNRPGRVIGEVVLELGRAEHAEGEIGWGLHPDHTGHGYMTEAMLALIDVAFKEIGFHRLTALIDARNKRALAMASRLGMRQEGRFVAAEWSRGAWRDNVLYALLNVDWRAPAPGSAEPLQA
jgi:RimJ/RimL family protein N-acetyltransferase